MKAINYHNYNIVLLCRNVIPLTMPPQYRISLYWCQQSAGPTTLMSDQSSFVNGFWPTADFFIPALFTIQFGESCHNWRYSVVYFSCIPTTFSLSSPPPFPPPTTTTPYPQHTHPSRLVATVHFWRICGWELRQEPQ